MVENTPTEGQRNSETFELYVDDDREIEKYEKLTSVGIKRGKARFANWLALFLVTGILLSFPLIVWFEIKYGEGGTELIEKVFDKWIAVIGPLAGTAIGGYFGARVASEG